MFLDLKFWRIRQTRVSKKKFLQIEIKKFQFFVHFSKLRNFLLLSEVNTQTTQNAVNQNVRHLERTFIMLKPDSVQRGLIGDIIKRFEAKGFKLVGLKLVWVRENFIS